MKIKVRLLETDEVVEILESEFDENLHSKSMTKPATSLAMDDTSRKRIVDQAIEADKSYQAEVKRLGVHFEMGQLDVQRQINLKTPIEQVVTLFTKARQDGAPKPAVNDIGFGTDYEAIEWRTEQMAVALAARAKRKEVPEEARQYAQMTMVEMAHECLTLAGKAKGLSPRGSAGRIVELALTTSDYPNLLANIATKMLRPDYDAATPTYRLLSERVDLPDFKTASVLKVGDFPLPLQVAESAEIKLGAFSEAKDTYALATYGRRIMLSMQAIVNDDLNAFNRVMTSAGRRLADFENGLWFTSLISASGAGPTLGDTGALFNATAVTTAGGHANLTSSGTAIDVTSIGVGRAMMRKQVSLDGIKLNIVPKYILTSPDKETLARQYTTVLGPNLAPSSQNPWAGQLEPLADANLTTANPWYLFADPSVLATAVYGYLQGEAGPMVATRPGFETLGVEMRVALNFGFSFVEFRGAYRNAGA